jgi:hypothetical protein
VVDGSVSGYADGALCHRQRATEVYGHRAAQWLNMILCVPQASATTQHSRGGMPRLSPGRSWSASRQVACMWGAEMLNSSAASRMGESASASPWQQSLTLMP